METGTWWHVKTYAILRPNYNCGGDSVTIPEEEREAIAHRLNRVAYHLEDGLGPNGLLGPYTEEQADAVRGLVDDLDYVLNWLEAQPEAPQPDWATAPPWVNWWAADANGETHWFVSAPKVFDSIWMPHPHLEIIDDDGDVDLPVGIDWRTTLRRRPEVTE